MFKLLNKVYVINLKKNKDRRFHVTNELCRVGLGNKMKIFDAIDKDSIEVINLMKGDLVSKFPPCFRCGKKRCGCKNNSLVPPQIGNWCSFIGVMKDIVAENYERLVMICEDDVKFMPNGIANMRKMINLQTFRRLGINLSKPLLIRLGASFANHLHKYPNRLTFTKQKVPSNPCFIINRPFAIIFLKNLKKINTTSDVYIHKQLVNRDRSIQHFTLLPLPVFDLSTGRYKKFFSEIHPKNINKQDRKRNKDHHKKVEYKEFLCIGHPRCGTGSISHYLNKMGYNIGHEKMMRNGTSSWLLSVNDIDNPWCKIIRDKFYFEVVIHIVRNPYTAIPSIMLENKYSPNNASYKFRRKHIKEQLEIDLPKDVTDNTPFEEQVDIAIKTLVYWSKLCGLLFPNVICQIENVSPLNKFNRTGINLNNLSKQKKNSGKLYNGKKYPKPVIDQSVYDRLPEETKKLLKWYCTTYGYTYKQ